MTRTVIAGAICLICARSVVGVLSANGPEGSCSAAASGGGAASADDIVTTAVKAGKFKTLAAALKAAGLDDDLMGKGPFTVFAPTDEAFAKLPKGTVETLLKPENKAMLESILKQHVVAGEAMAKDVVTMPSWTTLSGQRIDVTSKGGKVMIDNATVVMADVECSNGVVHAIDTVLMPADQDIVQTAMKAGSFNTLVAALKAAGWDDDLKGAGPFTVFAPTDAAFEKLPPGTVENLMKPENKDKLVNLLTYHVVAGRVYADQVAKMSSGKTVQGESVKVMAKNGSVMIDGATVVMADVETSNGVIHAVDTVLMPK
ncbi:MAG: fasciclin domain-containing protein [Phycisphaerales bacterium]|nr:fasciclin domain-containing protein [Phycisphaerales bacterium]